MKRVFAQRLKEAREERAMSMDDLANKIGISKGSIWKYEQGLREPKVSACIKIANALGVNFDWIIGDSEEKYIATTSEEVQKLFLALPENKKVDAIRYLKFLARSEE